MQKYKKFDILNVKESQRKRIEMTEKEEIKKIRSEYTGFLTDLYACPGKTAGVITNISELLMSSDTDAALCFCESEEKYRRREVSDFEYFAELMRVLPMLFGTHTYDTVTTALCAICDDRTVIKKEFSNSDICVLWKRANERIAELCGGEYEILLQKFGVEKLYYDEIVSSENLCVGKYYTSGADTTFVFDMKNIDFIRPDPYHCDIAMKKKNNGEKLNFQEISLVLSQSLYLKLSEKNRGKIQLHLRADNDGKNASALINYFKGRRFPLEIFLAFEGGQSVETLTSLCLLSDENVRIRPEIVITGTDSFVNLCARSKLLFAAYPSEKIGFGGAVTDSPAFFAEHLLFRSALERARKDMGFSI